MPRSSLKPLRGPAAMVERRWREKELESDFWGSEVGFVTIRHTSTSLGKHARRISACFRRIRPEGVYAFSRAEGTAANAINTTVWLTVYRDDADRHQEIISAVRDSANTVFGKVETALSLQPYISGNEFTAADIMMGFTLGSAKWLQLLTDAYPKTLEYVDRLFARPALQKSLS